MDWRLLNVFVHVARTGSLTAAARGLGISQPTASRQVQELENRLGVKLFVRQARGLSLTERGADLLGVAEALDENVQQLLRRATGLRETPTGSVRVAVNEPLGVYALMPAYSQALERFPQIELELVVDNRVQNLFRREADIAVRMFRPTQADLIAKHIGAVGLGLFASPAYIERRGLPAGPQDISKHIVLGLDRDPVWLDALRTWGLAPKDFRLRTESIVAHVQAVLDGVGIGGLHLPFAAQHPSLVRVMPELPLGALEVWLVMHQDARKSAAIRAVFEVLEASLRGYLAA